MRKLAKIGRRESNSPSTSIPKRIVSITTVSNNYQAAAIEGFRLLSSMKKMGYSTKEFNQELCKTLVLKYGLSCLDCKLSCEMHEWEKLRFPAEAIK